MLTATGVNLIGGTERRGGGSTFSAFHPREGRHGALSFAEATAEEVRQATALAATAFARWRSSAPADRAAFLRRAAELLDGARSELVMTADAETGLGAARLNGELDRTTGQLRLFADLLEEGSYVEAIRSASSARSRGHGIANPSSLIPDPESRIPNPESGFAIREIRDS